MSSGCPLVSVVTPCYNVENKIKKYFDSMLEQTYTNIQLILVNDGSTDKTADVIESYIPKLISRNICVKYLYQENLGAAGAVANGLNYVQGEYLIWPDADDFLTPDSIEARVNFLNMHPEYSMVRTNAYVVDSNTPDKLDKLIVSSKNIRRTKIYNECIRFRTFYCPGCYMVRWSSFLEANPQKYIYRTRYGQNIQMLVPLAYKFRCGSIDRPLYGYVIYNDSHSRLGGDRSYQRKMDYSRNVEKTTLNTMNYIGAKKRDIKNVKNDFLIRRMKIAYDYHNDFDLKEEYINIDGLRKFGPTALIMRFLKKTKFTDTVLKYLDLWNLFLFKLLNQR